jgi:hypothetical protein
MPRPKLSPHPWTLPLREARQCKRAGHTLAAAGHLKQAYEAALHANRTEFHRAHAADAVITDIKRLAREWAVDLEG